jgi:hypothetical protein
MTHDLKTWPVAFQAILDGLKTYEIRKADRPFTAGDTLLLREYDTGYPESADGHYTGRSIERRVTYMTAGGEWGLPADLCVMALAPPSADKGGGR